MIVGFLFAPQISFAGVYTTPEAALLIGNVFSFIASPKAKLILNLKEKIQIAPTIFEFAFTPNQTPSYEPGQYMEWTLAHQKPDARGNRRYFTLASSPTEKDLKIGVKFNENSSSFKKSLLNITRSPIVASQIAGDFTLPKDTNQKLVFVAGGIGVTPYRSMIKYLVDSGQKRDVIMFYAASTKADFVYKEIFSEAETKIGMKIIYVPSDTMGHINEEMIRSEVPDFAERMFYLSGSHGMVEAFKATLSKMGITNIKTDYFPGFA
jgi:ferredoxin-NADP reductase